MGRWDLRDDSEGGAKRRGEVLERHVRLVRAVAHGDVLVVKVALVVRVQGAVGALLEQRDGLDEHRHACGGADGARDVNVRRRDVVELQRRRAAPARAQRRAADVEHAARLLEGFSESHAEREPSHVLEPEIIVVDAAAGEQLAQLPQQRAEEWTV